MQRKVAKIGPSTLMISLPSAWTKQHRIKKGDDITVTTEGKTLLINSITTNHERSIVINTEHLNHMLNRIVGACYKKGYTNVTLQFPNNKTLQQHYEHLSTTWTGMEIIEQTATSITFKQLSTLREEDYASMLNRTFLFLIATSHEAYEAAATNNKEQLTSITTRDKTQNKYCDVCRKILNTHHLPNSNAHYYLVEQLEKLGDFYRDFSTMLTTKKITAEQLKHYAAINDYLQELYHLHNKFTYQNYENYGEKYHKLKQQLINKESAINHYLLLILETMFDMNGAEAIINLQEVAEHTD